MISVQNVSKSFGPIQALRSVSFEIHQKEVVGFLGPNGAGKTTMMRILTGFFPPSEGKVLIAGCDLFHSSPNLRKQIGYLPENNPLYRDMTAGSFLSYVASLKGISSPKQKSAIQKVAEQCGIESVFKRLIGTLSKGYRQRIGLAQALLGDPNILVLDEPTSGLDPKQIIEIRTLIRTLGRERTILLSTHILPEVQAACERILILNEGKLVASGTPEDLEGRLKNSEEFLITLRGPWQKGDEFIRLVPGVLETSLVRDSGVEREYRIRSAQESSARSQIARFIIEAGFELLSLKSADWSLEDIFLKIVTRETQEIPKKEPALWEKS